MTHDCAVVGAGIAGLATADRLAAAGLDVVVLEARERVGGRLLSLPTADGSGGVDLGASWCWGDEARVLGLVRRLGIRTHPQHLAGDALLQTADGVQRVRGNPIDAPATRFSDGAQALPLALAAGLGDRVRLATPVRAVRIGDDGVEVAHGDATTRARTAVLALPPALAAAAIEVDPPLPADLAGLAARTPVWMGAVAKVVAEYDEPFWRRAGLAGAAISYVGPLREVHDLSGADGDAPALFGFAMPSPVPVTRTTILDQLAALFGEAARTPRALHVQDWRDEPLTSPPGVELLGDYGTYGDPRYRAAIGGRLWLAATETGRDHAGHIEGALAAAEAVGDAVIESLG